MKLKKYYLEVILTMIIIVVEITILLHFQSRLIEKKKMAEEFAKNSVKKAEIKQDKEESIFKDNQEEVQKEEKKEEKKEKRKSKKVKTKKKKKKKYLTTDITEGIVDRRFEEYYYKYKKYDENFIEACILKGSFQDPNHVIETYNHEMKKNYSKKYNIKKKYTQFINLQVAINTVKMMQSCSFTTHYWTEYFEQFHWANFDYSMSANDVSIKEKWMKELYDSLFKYRENYFK